MKPSYCISEILDRLPDLTVLFERDGRLPLKFGAAWFVQCPFHDEESPSCQIDNAHKKFHCHSCGASGDPFDYWQKSHGLSFQDTLTDLASIAGIGPARRAVPAPVHSHSSKAASKTTSGTILFGDPLDKWHRATTALLNSNEEIQRIAKWRGIAPDAVAFAAERGLLGLYSYQGRPREAFLVEMPSSSGLVPVAVHLRLAPGNEDNKDESKEAWRFVPSGCGAWPWIVGNPATAEQIFLIDDPWSALTLISIMGWYRDYPENVAVIGLRGPTSGAKLLKHSINSNASVFAFADSCETCAKWFGKRGLLESIADRLSNPHRLHHFWPTHLGVDVVDSVNSGAMSRDLLIFFILPYLPSPRTRVDSSTFLQWCRQHRDDPAPIGTAATYVIADKNRPFGRRPLADWKKHWKRTQVPSAFVKDLLLIWASYKDTCPTIDTLYPHLAPIPEPNSPKRKSSKNW